MTDLPQAPTTATYIFSKDDLLKLEATIAFARAAAIEQMKPTNEEQAIQAQEFLDWQIGLERDILEQLRGMAR